MAQPVDPSNLILCVCVYTCNVDSVKSLSYVRLHADYNPPCIMFHTLFTLLFSSRDLNVVPAWIQGVTGKNITTAVVDTGEYIVVMTVFAKFRSFI